MNFEYDLFVIGGGSGGVRAARVAAQSGAKVGLARKTVMVEPVSSADAFPKN